jgi:hypothetical protein
LQLVEIQWSKFCFELGPFLFWEAFFTFSVVLEVIGKFTHFMPRRVIMSRTYGTIVLVFIIELLAVIASVPQLEAALQLEQREILEKSQQAIDQLIQSTSQFRKVRFEYSTSHGIVPMELSKRDNEAVLIQLPTSKDPTERYKRPILGVNDAYNFELTRNGSELSIASLQFNSNNSEPVQRYLHTWSNIYSKGFLTLPEFIPYADVNLDESEWGFASASPTPGKLGCYSISFNPKKQNHLSSEGIPLKYGQIKSGSITLDPSKNFLPIDATIQYGQVNDSGNLQSWRVEVKWDYTESSDGGFLVSGTEMRYFGDSFEDFEPNREWNYQNNISNVTWHKEIARDEFLISRFGFAEPPNPNNGGSSLPVWLILVGVIVVVFAIGSKVLRKSTLYAEKSKA